MYLHKSIFYTTLNNHVWVYLYMIITYRIQGVKASLFCTNGELQNSCEHCGGHAVKIIM